MPHNADPHRVLRFPERPVDIRVQRSWAGDDTPGDPGGDRSGRVVRGRFGRHNDAGGDGRADGHEAAGGDGTSELLSRTPRVLVVDHDRQRCSELGELFSDIGYEAYEADNVARANRWFAQVGEIDVMLLDLNLPDEGAFDLLAALSGGDDRHRPVVVALARRDQRALALDAMNEGAFDWQETPIDIAMLSHAIARATEHVRLQRIERMFRGTP